MVLFVYTISRSSVCGLKVRFRACRFSSFCDETSASSWSRCTYRVCWSSYCRGCRSGSTSTLVRRVSLSACWPLWLSWPLWVSDHCHWPLIDRPADRTDDDHPVDGGQLVDAARVLHQSYRRVDVHVSVVCVRRATRVRCRQRDGSTSRPAHSALNSTTAVRPAVSRLASRCRAASDAT